MKTLFRFFVSMAFVFTLVPMYAYSICTGSMTITPTISFSEQLVFPVDAPIGTIFATGSSIAQFKVKASTSGTPVYLNYYNVFVKTPAKPVMVINDKTYVYKTNIDGVGITYPDTQIDSRYSDEVYFFFGYPEQQYYDTTFTVNFKYQLVKTGDTFKSATLNGHFGDFFYRCHAASQYNQPDYYFGTQLYTSGTPTIIEPPCKITNANIQVPMGIVNITRFNRKGAVSAPTAFDIPLVCSNSGKVSFTLSPGISGSQDIINGIINLDNPTAATTAKGIGLQITYDNKPTELNKKISAGTAQRGNFNIQLKAQYIQTKETVSAGTANASATFIISYD